MSQCAYPVSCKVEYRLAINSGQNDSVERRRNQLQTSVFISDEEKYVGGTCLRYTVLRAEEPEDLLQAHSFCLFLYH